MAADCTLLEALWGGGLAKAVGDASASPACLASQCADSRTQLRDGEGMANSPVINNLNLQCPGFWLLGVWQLISAAIVAICIRI
jgi:hypothetical protein